MTQVDQITWKYKLAPETMNLAATKAVGEIQVFGISLRNGKLDEEVLRAIDRAIPFPLIFELSWSGKRKAVAAFKRSSDADATKRLSAHILRPIGRLTMRRASLCRWRSILAVSTTPS